jgi:2-iminoacetate synthase
MIDLRDYDSFEPILDSFEDFDFESYLLKVEDEDIRRTLQKDNLSYLDFLNLLSPKAQNYLEDMARLSQKHYLRHFGRTIGLYIPIYISNYCSSECAYCGFSKKNKIIRKHLNVKEIENEAKEIAKTGIKHILLLTGESKKMANLEYLLDAVRVLKKYFSSVSIEIYPMEINEYKELKKAGVDGLTVYQEVYDRKIYSEVHTSGEKRDFSYRLNTPERGAKAGFRAISIGSLFGLGKIEKEAFFSGLHAKYLMDKYLECEISLSLPRINHAEGDFKPKYTLDDKTFLQIMLAYRIYMPMVGINVSTRERAEFRDNLIGLGVTRLSAGSKTDVGGYEGKDSSTAQFDISDDRSVDEIVKAIKQKGYQPVFKDWLVQIGEE